MMYQITNIQMWTQHNLFAAAPHPQVQLRFARVSPYTYAVIIAVCTIVHMNIFKLRCCKLIWELYLYI